MFVSNSLFLGYFSFFITKLLNLFNAIIANILSGEDTKNIKWFDFL